MQRLVLFIAVFVLVEGYSEDDAFKTDDIFNEPTAAVRNVGMDSPMPKYVTSSIFRSHNNARRIVKILVSINYGGDFFPIGPICTQAMAIALDRLRLQNSWLPNYEIAIELIDDECDDASAIERLTPLLRDGNSDKLRLPVVMASMCVGVGQPVSADLMSQFNLMGLAMIQSLAQLQYNRKRFGHFFALGESGDSPYLALVEFIYRMGWRKVAVISENFSFYDDIDKRLISACDAKNITVTWLGKISYLSTNADEMSSAYEDMARKDPRIIISSSDSPINTACWSYRYGLYGPNYAHFFLYWSYWDERTQIPEYIADWCTLEILQTVRKGAFFFGDATKPQVSNNDASTIVDSTGLTYPQFVKELSKRVPDGEASQLWDFWHTACYDQTIFLGYLLNATETILSAKNETMLDWATGSENFQTKPSEIYRVLEQSLYNTSVVGFKGDYFFDRATTVNSKGYTPMVISQVHENDTTLVAYYKGNEKDKLHVIPGSLLWRTVDGLPMRDSLHIIERDLLVLSLPEFAGFATSGSIGLVVSLAIAVKLKWGELSGTLNPSLDNADVASQLGNVLLFAHVFALPNGAREDIYKNCIALTTVIVIGFSCMLIGLVMKIESATLNSSRRSSNDRRFSNKSTIQLAVPLIWAAWNTVLLVSFLWKGNLSSASITSPTIEMSKTDSSVGFRNIIYQCRITETNPFVTAVLGLFLSGNILLLLRGVFRTFQLKSNLGRRLPADCRRAGFCLLCELSVLLAAGLIVALDFSNFRFLLITISATFCVVPSVNSVFFFFTQSFETISIAPSFLVPSRISVLPMRNSQTTMTLRVVRSSVTIARDSAYG